MLHTPTQSETLDKILHLYEKLQGEITKAHIAYQTLTEKSHLAYLAEARIVLEDIRKLALSIKPVGITQQMVSSVTTTVAPVPIGVESEIQDSVNSDLKTQSTIFNTVTDKTDYLNIASDEKTPLFHVTQATHTYLVDHSIKNAPVVPICLALEWFMRTAQQYFPNYPIRVCEEVRVLKPIRLDHFKEGHIFHVQWEKHIGEQGDYLKLGLQSAAGVLHYTANIPLNKKVTTPLFKPITLPLGKEWPWSVAEVYQQKVIFHGPAFQVLQSLTNLSHVGGEGVLLGIVDRSIISPSWHNELWLLDVAMLDGGLQMCWLWNCTVSGPVLPMMIKRFVLYNPGLTTAPVLATLQVLEKSKLQTVFRVQYCAQNGQPLAEVDGLVGIALPST